MPEQNTASQNRHMTTDDNLIAFAKNIAQTYGKMGLLSKRLVANAAAMTNNIDAVNKVISRVGQLDPESKKVFGNYFVGNDLEHLDMATRAPAFLAAAYEYISEHRNDSDEMRARFDRIGAHVDRLSADFANSGGMVVNTDGWPLVDTNNIADAYEGLLHTFAARRADVEQLGDNTKVDEYNQNLDLLKTVISEYDHNWGLSNLHSEHAGKLDERWNDLWDALNRAELTPELKEKLHRWGFTDAKGNEIPQFNKNGKLDKAGRLAAIIDLTRHDIAKQHAARVNERIDEDALAHELNEAIEFKLYNMAVADKVATAAKVTEMRAQDPDYEPDYQPEIDMDRLNNDPDYRAYVLDELSEYGATISDTGYNAQVDADVNATAGWVARVKSKLGGAAENVGGFFERVFHPISRVDRLANVRLTGNMVDKRAKRIEFFKRILKGFASAFVASAIITTVATAAAATAGISLAVSMAAIGMMTAIGMGVVQVMRWRKAQQQAGRPTDIRALLADKRLVASLGVSAIAVIAMCFGAAGMAKAAVVLGYGAMALGGGKNAIETYRDARNKMSIAESLAWAIANAGAVIAGGLMGRMTANAAIDAYNERNPENTLFQNKHAHTETREVTDTREVTEMRHELTPEAEAYAKRTVEMWYRDNPDLLQQRIDGINEYNATHGTDYNPYRVLLANGHAGGLTADNMLLHVENSHLDPNIHDIHSHGIHKSMTDAWGAPRGISHQMLDDAGRGLFNPDGTPTDAGMNAIGKVEPYIYEHGQIGPVHGVGNPSSADHVFHDKYFPDNDPRGWTTYGDGKPAYIDNEYTHPETFTRTENINVVDYSRAHGDGMAMFGNYNRPAYSTPRDRIGSSDSYPFNPLRPGDRRPPREPIIDEPDDDDVYDDTGVLPPAVIEKPGYPVHVPRPGVPAERPNDVYPPIHVPRPGTLVKRPGDDSFKPVVVDKPGLPDRGNNGPADIVRIGDDDEITDKIFAIKLSDARAWQSLHKKLETKTKKRDKAKSAADRKKYNIEITDINYDIHQLRNKLGHADFADIDLAATQAIKRAELEQRLIELGNLMHKEPSPQQGKFKHKDWELNIEKAKNRIAQLRDELGAAAYNMNLYFPEPVPGVQKQKEIERFNDWQRKHPDAQINVVKNKPKPQRQGPDITDVEPIEEIDSLDEHIDTEREPIDVQSKLPTMDQLLDRMSNTDKMVGELRVPEPQKPDFERPDHKERGGFAKALRRAYDKVKQHVMGRKYFVPDALADLAMRGNITNEPIANIRGVPVYLVDLNGDNTPVTQNDNRAMVVVDINGLRMPFYLANGNEGRRAGYWRPLPELYRDGKWISHAFDDNGLNNIPELFAIANALNTNIGDVRNYRDTELTAEYNAAGNDGFVGGADAVEHLDPEYAFELVKNAKYQDADNHEIFGTYNDSALRVAEPGWLRQYMAGLSSSDYVDEKSQGLFGKIFKRRA